MPGWDTIIVGGGSAGCVLAAELSRDPGHRVLLIESGRPDRSPWIHIPGTFFRVMKAGIDSVVYRGEPEEGLGGRPCLVPQGHVLGGVGQIKHFTRGEAELGCGNGPMRGDGLRDQIPQFTRGIQARISRHKRHAA